MWINSKQRAEPYLGLTRMAFGERKIREVIPVSVGGTNEAAFCNKGKISLEVFTGDGRRGDRFFPTGYLSIFLSRFSRAQFWQIGFPPLPLLRY